MTIDPAVMRAVLEDARWREAIGSVSLSHPDACTCLVCRAAQGDEDAYIRVRNSLLDDQ